MSIQTEESKTFDEAVFNFVAGCGENGVLFCDIYKNFPEKDHSVVANALRRLCRQNRLKKASRGLYAAA